MKTSTVATLLTCALGAAGAAIREAASSDSYHTSLSVPITKDGVDSGLEKRWDTSYTLKYKNGACYVHMVDCNCKKWVKIADGPCKDFAGSISADACGGTLDITNQDENYLFAQFTSSDSSCIVGCSVTKKNQASC